MIILLHGPDKYRLLQKKKEIIDVYVTRNAAALDFKKFDLEKKEDFVALDDFFKTHSLFVTKKLAVVDNCFAKEKEFHAFLLSMEAHSDPVRTILISHYADLPKTQLGEFFRKEKNVKIQNFPLPTKAYAMGIIRDTLGAKGIIANARVISAFAEYSGGDMGKLDTALEQLILWKQTSHSLEATEDDLGYFIPETEENVFALVEALIKKDIQEIFHIVSIKRYAKHNVWDLLRILDFELKQLMLVMGNDKNGIRALSPWVRGKLETIARVVSEKDIVFWYKTIASLDARLKRSEIGEEEAFEELVFTPFFCRV